MDEKESKVNFTFGKKFTVLVAEDLDTNFKLVKYLLESLGFLVIRANNGKEAVEKHLEHPEVDFIMMDLKMPVMDGLTATREIRKINSKIPIIAQTAYIDDKQAAFDAGCSAFLSKPFDKKKLSETIRKFV